MGCNYPNCDGGPATGYCHTDCRGSRETRFIECPGCNGEGGHFTCTGMDHRGDPTGYWTGCHICDGKREVEVEVEPIAMEDLPSHSTPKRTDAK